MLQELRVQHFAIIDDLTLHFAPGLTVFSGETGAGKSIIIEALGFVLGARGDVSLIKDGAHTLCVQATFTTSSLPRELQKQYALNEEHFTLRRELDKKGKNRAFVQGRAVTVSTLAQLGQVLVDFHGQHDHQSLLHPSVHLLLLDQFAKHEKLVTQVAAAYKTVQDIRGRLDAVRLSEQEKQRLLDMSQYQLDEIERIAPKPNEDIELEQELPKLKHAGKLLELAAQAYDELYAADSAATARVGRSVRALTHMAELDENLSSLAQNAQNALTLLEDTAATLSDYKDGLDVDETTLDKLLERHEKIKRLKLKYGPEISDVLQTAEKLHTQIEHIQHAQEHEQDLLRELDQAQQKLLTLAQTLHDKRLKAAEKLAAQITAQIKPLGFNQVKFGVAVDMDEQNITSTGADKVEFLFSPNPGSALRALKNIASGGEISRVMLGLKTVLASSIPVMVFDEVDAGIGGQTGWLVGEKLRACAQGRQVLCVTHLAQVAAQADQHFYVAKSAHKQTTHVSITPLQGENVTAEIARMLGGADVHSAAYSHAKELLANASKAAH